MQVPFGGSLRVGDPAIRFFVNGRMFGDAEVTVTNPSAWQSAVAQAGGEEAITHALQHPIRQAVIAALEAMVEANGVANAIQSTPALMQQASEGASRTVASMGAAISISKLNVIINDEDMQRARELSAEAAEKKRAAPGQLSPGTHVIARWSDGREFGATIRGWNGTVYEIVWDGGSASAFVPRENVRPG